MAQVHTDASPDEREPLEAWLIRQAERVEEGLDRFVPAESAEPRVLHRAMRYSLLAGGKRMRPALCIAAGEIFDAPDDDVLRAGCAIEMIHTYSLIHDDLPSMDDDDLRRGRPTCHKVFGEALAILAGDALLTRAFEVLAGSTDPDGAERRLAILAEIAAAAGTPFGMVAGQVFDIEGGHRATSESQLDRLHAAKTGAMLTVSVVAGARCGGAPDDDLERLRVYGRSVGLAFQIADDLLDVTGTPEELGKTPGKDAAAGKATYPAVYGLEASRARARSLVETALDVLQPFGERAERLREIACFVIDRRK